MSTHKDQSEEMLTQVLEWLDAGMTHEEICKRFSEHEHELNGCFEILGTLAAQRKIQPPKELLETVMRNVNAEPKKHTWFERLKQSFTKKET